MNSQVAESQENPETFYGRNQRSRRASNSTQHPLSDEEKELLIRFTEQMEEEDGNIEINAKVTASQQLHFTHDKKKKEISLEE